MRWLGPLISACLLGVALWFLSDLLATTRFEEVAAEFDALPASRIAAAIVLTGCSYLLLTFYDVMALRHIGRPQPFIRVVLVAFTSNAFAHNIGLGLLTGGSLRYRLYSASGLSAVDVGTISLFGGLTLGLGIAAMGGTALLMEPEGVIAGLPDLPAWLGRTLGAGFLGVAALYVLSCLFVREAVDIRGTEFRFPTWQLAVTQILVAVADITFAAGAMYMLMPDVSTLPPLAFLGAFAIAILAGVISNVPGGLGIIETGMVLLLPDQPPEAVLAGALAYRVVYYVLPFVFAAILVLGAEIAERRHFLTSFGRALGHMLVRFAPLASGVFVLLGGIVLLISGASPATESRLGVLSHTVPLALLEASHLLASVTGVGLIILARGLIRRLDAAYYLAMAALSAGIVFSLLKGFDYEEAAILGLVLALVFSSRNAFYRKTSLMAEPFTPAWLLTIGVIVAAAGWIGFFAYRHVEYSNDLWWTFAFDAEAPRFLRALFVVTVIALSVAFYQVLRPVRPLPLPPLAADMTDVGRISGGLRATDINLAYLGDKQLLFNSERTGFVMYGAQGGSMIAMGDPFAPDDAAVDELAWSFRELCDSHDRRPVFYQVSEDHLPQYIDMGLSLQKLGEEAVIPLKDFSLDGAKRRDLRQTHARAVREGLRFEVVPAHAVRGLLPDLEAVSNAWLSEKSTREKGFSVGSFRADYLLRFPCAIVRAGDRLVGFATVWQGGTGEELSVDLMRHVEDAPYGVMDFLFVEMMLWGRAQGYSSFNMGLAPLSGLESHPLAPVWHRAGAFIFRYGENFYNFEGLRRYKAKFHPQWRAKYLATQGGLNVAAALYDVATLISGGVRGLVTK